MDSNGSIEVCVDFNHLLADCQGAQAYDMTVTFGNTKFYCHSFIFLVRSKFFQDICKSNRNSSYIEVDLSDMPGGASAFTVIRKFCYGQPVSITPKNVLSLMYAAKFLGLRCEGKYANNLLEYCEDFWRREVLGSWRYILGVLSSPLGEEKEKHLGECRVALVEVLRDLNAEELAMFFRCLVSRHTKSLVYLLKILRGVEMGIVRQGATFLLALESAFLKSFSKGRRSGEHQNTALLVEFLHDMLRQQLSPRLKMAVIELPRAADPKRPRATLYMLAFLASYFSFNSHHQAFERLVAVQSKFFKIVTAKELAELQPSVVLQVVRPFFTPGTQESFPEDISAVAAVVDKYLRHVSETAVSSIDLHVFVKLGKFVSPLASSHDSLCHAVAAFVKANPGLSWEDTQSVYYIVDNAKLAVSSRIQLGELRRARSKRKYFAERIIFEARVIPNEQERDE